MSTTIKKFFIILPGILWIFGSYKLLFKATQSLFPLLNNKNYIYCVLLIALSWCIASLKFHFCFKKTVTQQKHLSLELITNRIGSKKYFYNIIFSRRIAIIFIMILLSAFTKSFITSPNILFFIRLTIGYALLKTSIAYFSMYFNIIKEPQSD